MTDAGGGAGGLRCNTPTCPAPRRTPSLSLDPGPYTITVGDGGTFTGYGGVSSRGNLHRLHQQS